MLQVEPPAPGCATLTLHTATRDAGCSSPSVSLTVDQYGLGLVAGATCIDAPQPLAASVLVTAGGVPLVFYEVRCSVAHSMRFLAFGVQAASLRIRSGACGTQHPCVLHSHPL